MRIEREAFPIVTSTKTVEDKCSETKKGKGKIKIMIRRGKNRKVSKNASSVKVFIINRFPLPYVTFSKTGSQMLDSSTKTCKKRKGKRRKRQAPKTVPKPRKKKKKTEKHWEATFFTKT